MVIHGSTPPPVALLKLKLTDGADKISITKHVIPLHFDLSDT